MEEDAILCTSCGFNIETGQSAEAAAASPPPAPARPGGPPPTLTTVGKADDGKILFWVLAGLGLLMFATTFATPYAVTVLYGYNGTLTAVVWLWAAIVAWPYGKGRFFLTLLTPYSIYFIYKHSFNGRLKGTCSATLITLLWTLIAVIILIIKAASAAKAEIEAAL